jgi:hypothetical protein
MAESEGRLFEAELKTFQDRLPEWLSHDIGRYALIRGSEALGPYDTENDAIQIGYDTYGMEPFLVREIRPFDVPRTYTRDIF